MPEGLYQPYLHSPPDIPQLFIGYIKYILPYIWFKKPLLPVCPDILIKKMPYGRINPCHCMDTICYMANWYLTEGYTVPDVIPDGPRYLPVQFTYPITLCGKVEGKYSQTEEVRSPALRPKAKTHELMGFAIELLDIFLEIFLYQ